MLKPVYMSMPYRCPSASESSFHGMVTMDRIGCSLSRLLAGSFSRNGVMAPTRQVLVTPLRRTDSQKPSVRKLSSTTQDPPLASIT